jgi:hypothetical protein
LFFQARFMPASWDRRALLNNAGTLIEALSTIAEESQ